jgi:hypothetical protein
MRHWEGLDTAGLVWRAINVFHYDDRVRAALLFGWVLNFQWVATLLLLAFAALAHRRRALIPPPDRRHTLLLALLMSGTLCHYALLPAHSPRYLLPFYGVFLLLLFQLLTVAAVSGRSRITLLVMILGLSFPALYRSIDPVTSWQFGTFRFGKHDMYRMTSIARGCCGYGRDQLVYNPVRAFFTTQNLLFPRIAPDPTRSSRSFRYRLGDHLQLTTSPSPHASSRHVIMPVYTTASELPLNFPEAERSTTSSARTRTTEGNSGLGETLSKRRAVSWPRAALALLRLRDAAWPVETGEPSKTAPSNLSPAKRCRMGPSAASRHGT